MHHKNHKIKLFILLLLGSAVSGWGQKVNENLVYPLKKN